MLLRVSHKLTKFIRITLFVNLPHRTSITMYNKNKNFWSVIKKGEYYFIANCRSVSAIREYPFHYCVEKNC